MPAVGVVDKYLATQFNGSNQAEIAAALSSYTFVSLIGGTLTFTNNGNNYSLATNDWMRHSQGNFLGAFTPSDFAFAFNVLASASDVTSLDSRVDALEAAGADGVLAAGVGVVPTLLLNASATVAVDVVPAQPSSSYTPNSTLIAAAGLLGSLSITGMSVVDANTVNVTVQNTGLASVSGVNVLVTVTA